MASTEKKLFVIGALFSVLILLALLILQSVTRGTKQNENRAIISASEDLLITKQLRIEDILPDDKPLVTFIDPARGAENPQVIIVEFSDFSCPFCKTVQETLNKILNKYPTEVLHVWKDAPNDTLYRESISAHIAARCAQKQQKFWEYHDLLFENQNTLSVLTFQTIANAIPMDQSVWQRCFDEGSERAKVERGLTEAEVLRIDGTPYFFINDKRISGAITFEELDILIAEELKNVSI